MPLAFCGLPPKLIKRILLFCQPRDVATFSRTCRSAYQLAYQDDDQYLWRELFLSRPFDDLRKTVLPLIPSKPLEQHDWRGELQRRVEAEIVVGREELAGDPRLPRALETLVSVVETALPISDGPESDTSESLQWLDPLLNKLTKLDANSVAVPERKLLARLMAYVALSYERSSDDSLGDEVTKRRLRELRKHSRCYVYDLRRYKPETYYGPYTPGADGEIVVNWEHVMHVVNVVALKLWELPMLALRLYCKPPAGLSSTQAYSAPFSHDRKPYDWAGVEGTWRRFVCFMDSRDLLEFNYNFQGNRNPEYFDDEYQEAIRPVELRFEAIDPQLTSGSPASSSLFPLVNPNYPPLFFKGVSSAAHNGDATVEGHVRLLTDGAIRWFFVTKYDGVTQWSTEGVQIGNVCSAAGVAGIWTGAFHEEADPSGPFWMWKVPGSLSEGFRI